MVLVERIVVVVATPAVKVFVIVIVAVTARLCDEGEVVLLLDLALLVEVVLFLEDAAVLLGDVLLVETVVAGAREHVSTRSS